MSGGSPAALFFVTGSLEIVGDGSNTQGAARPVKVYFPTMFYICSCFHLLSKLAFT